MKLSPEHITKALEGFDWSAFIKPNPIFSAMMGHTKWYVKPFIRFAPKRVHTFTERRRVESSGWEVMSGLSAVDIIEHGYTSHHPLEFLYRWARKVATRKMRFKKVEKVEGSSFTVTLRGN